MYFLFLRKITIRMRPLYSVPFWNRSRWSHKVYIVMHYVKLHNGSFEANHQIAQNDYQINTFSCQIHFSDFQSGDIQGGKHFIQWNSFKHNFLFNCKARFSVANARTSARSENSSDYWAQRWQFLCSSFEFRPLSLLSICRLQLINARRWSKRQGHY